MKKIIECVPNFSEGQNMDVINQITAEIKNIEGVKLLDVDPGADTNRTVVTFVGTPEEVSEAAFQAVKKASELIDMSKHSGAHPRFGATDVCPLVPVSNISMEETVEYARKLAERIGTEIKIPVYCYEDAAYTEERRNLANCRKGEYEGLKEKLADPHWKPDFGPAEFNAKSGVTAVGARDFLVAFNVNLNTTSTRRANSIAFDVREKGRVKREGGKLTGKPVLDENGNKVWIPGSLKAVKGIGWYIKEYGIAQISMNLTNISVTSVHEAFDEVCKRADARGVRVTGSELVGLIPKKAMLDAGKYFLRKQKRSLGVSEEELMKIAVKSMGLDDLHEFKPENNVIEYMMEDDDKEKLIDMNLREFANETASESPAPGGGSISAYVGALGASLGTMVANLSSHKRGWDEYWEEYSKVAEKGQEKKDELMRLVDEDTQAFNKIMDAFRLPKKTEEEKAARREAINNATRYAIEVPYQVMKTAYESMEVMKSMAEKGMESSISDAGVGAICALAAVRGAYLNVRINTKDFDDKEFVDEMLKKAQDTYDKALAMEKEIVNMVDGKL
jgi:glutamate formiminotransferase/formiminotetrahydrofolate cyclodeaminase